MCYLAGKFIKILKENQKFLKITEEETLCVEIAALIHDLGHGPFSHSFEGFLHLALKDQEETIPDHEHISATMFDHLIEVGERRVKEGEVTESGGEEYTGGWAVWIGYTRRRSGGQTARDRFCCTCVTQSNTHTVNTHTHTHCNTHTVTHTHCNTHTHTHTHTGQRPHAAVHTLRS